MFYGTKLFYIWETETLKNFFYISGSNFPSSKKKKQKEKKKKTLLKNFLYFRKWNFLVPRLKTFLYFRRELTKSENQTKKAAPSMLLCFFTTIKHIEI